MKVEQEADRFAEVAARAGARRLAWLAGERQTV
jgi:hypothetical protein